MSPIKTTDLHRIFNQLDKNGDGLVSLEELRRFLEKIGFETRSDELEQLVGKESLDYIDFIFFHDNVIKEPIKTHDIHENKGNDRYSILEKDLLKAFEVFDLNGDGFISSEELQSSLSRLGLWNEQCGKDCKSMISFYDSNCDGKLDFEEFKDMMAFSNY